MDLPRERTMDTAKVAGINRTFVDVHRIVELDSSKSVVRLEATAVVITANHDLQKDLAKEVKHLEQYTRPVSIADLSTPERRADLKTRFALWLCQGML
ncbi:hypothetical protein MRB53_040817 [Persea americana]|nr:hypothetical protein MRB53_040817 [Persea americana]